MTLICLPKPSYHEQEGRGIAEGGKKSSGAKAKQARGKAGTSSSPGKYSIRCVMTQDNVSASHLAGYTELLLDPQRGGFIAVTADHNMIMLSPSSSVGKGSPGGDARPLLVSRRQIVGFNDEIIDIKSVPDGVLSQGCGQSGTGNIESWIAVATNSPQVSHLVALCMVAGCSLPNPMSTLVSWMRGLCRNVRLDKRREAASRHPRAISPPIPDASGPQKCHHVAAQLLTSCAEPPQYDE